MLGVVLLFVVVLLRVLPLDKGFDEPGGAEDAQNKGIEVQQFLGQRCFADGGALDRSFCSVVFHRVLLLELLCEYSLLFVP